MKCPFRKVALKTIATVSPFFFFKQWEFYEISCVVSLKRRVRPEKKCFDHFLSISKSVAGVTIVSCVVSYNLEIRKFPGFSTLFV